MDLGMDSLWGLLPPPEASPHGAAPWGRGVDAFWKPVRSGASSSQHGAQHPGYDPRSCACGNVSLPVVDMKMSALPPPVAVLRQAQIDLAEDCPCNLLSPGHSPRTSPRGGVSP